MPGHWRTKVLAPEEILEQIDRFISFLCEIEQDNLIGVYLHGSLAMGCFHPSRSDLDLQLEVRPIGAAAAAQYRGGAAAPIAISGAQALTVAQWIAPHVI